MVRRGELSDEQCSRVEPLLAGAKGKGGRPADDERRTVNGILWRLRTGSPWRDMPERYGRWNSVYQTFNRWSKQGVWQRVFKELRREADNEANMVDSSVVRAHQHAAGAKGGSSTSSSVVRAVVFPRRSMRWSMPEDDPFTSR